MEKRRDTPSPKIAQIKEGPVRVVECSPGIYDVLIGRTLIMAFPTRTGAEEKAAQINIEIQRCIKELNADHDRLLKALEKIQREIEPPEVKNE